MILKGSCRKCGHLFTWDEEYYSQRNHVVRCKSCKGLVGGGFKCNSCEQIVALINEASTKMTDCLFCGARYDTAEVDYV